MTIPISLLIDDGAPINPMYWLDPSQEHACIIPNAFTRRFADVCRRHGIRGKLSVMPCPSGLGRIDQKLS